MFFNKNSNKILCFFLLLSFYNCFCSFCSPPFSPVTLQDALAYEADICSLVTLNTRNKINISRAVPGTYRCLSPTIGDNGNDQPVAQALCFQNNAVAAIPYVKMGTPDCSSHRLATKLEVLPQQATYCGSIANTDILMIANGYFKGSNLVCDIKTSAGGTVTGAKCVPYSISLSLEPTGEIPIPCSSPCSTCGATPATCISCLSSHPKFYNDYCYSDCPNQTYQSSSTTCAGCLSL